MAPYDATQKWHHVHSPKLVVPLPPNHSTLQWHPTMAPRNGTTSTPQVGRPPPTIAQSMAPDGTQQSRPLPQVGRHPPPQP